MTTIAASLQAETSSLFVRRMRHMAAASGRLVGVLMNPLVMMFAVGYLFKGALQLPEGTSNYVDYMMPGVCLQVGLAGIGPTALSIGSDLKRGLMDRFRSMPIARRSVLIAHSLADTTLCVGGLAMIMLVGLALGWRPQCSPLEFLGGAAILVAFAHVMVWLGILIGLLNQQPESADSIGALILVIFTFLSTAILSSAALPSVIRPFAEWNPVSAVASVCRDLWGQPNPPATSFPTQHPLLVAAITLGVLLVACATVSLRRFGRRH